MQSLENSDRREYRWRRFWRRVWVRRTIKWLPVLCFIFALAVIAVQKNVHGFMKEQFASLSEAILSDPGFVIKTIEVSGNYHVTDALVSQILDIKPGDSSLRFDGNAGREKLEALGWIEAAHIRRYPSAGLVTIEIVEKKPEFIWRINGTPKLLDGEGEPIAVASSRNKWPTLPLIVGLGANEVIAEARRLYEIDPAFSKQIVGLVRIGERRWNIDLMNGMRLLLPEHDPEQVFHQFLQQNAHENILSRDILHVDLRLADYPVLRLTPEAIKTRQQANSRTHEPKGQGT